MTLSTGFKRVARSGPTIDGRTIKPEWLTQIAESYNPDDYTANIFPDHWYWSFNYGQVLAVKAEKDKDGVVTLYADMKPNDLWRADVKNGQRLYTSITVAENPYKPGTMYLSSLAATDNPASMGVEKMEFSKKNENSFFSMPIEGSVKDFFKSIEEQEAKKTKEPEFTKEEVGFFRKLFQFSKQETQEMADNKALEELQAKFSAMEKDFNDLKAKNAAGDSEGDDKTAKFSTLEKENADLKTKVAALEKDKGEFAAALESIKTQFNEYKTKLDDALKEDPTKNSQPSGNLKTLEAEKY